MQKKQVHTNSNWFLLFHGARILMCFHVYIYYICCSLLINWYFRLDLKRKLPADLPVPNKLIKLSPEVLADSSFALRIPSIFQKRVFSLLRLFKIFFRCKVYCFAMCFFQLSFHIFCSCWRNCYSSEAPQSNVHCPLHTIRVWDKSVAVDEYEMLMEIAQNNLLTRNLVITKCLWSRHFLLSQDVDYHEMLLIRYCYEHYFVGSPHVR